MRSYFNLFFIIITSSCAYTQISTSKTSVNSLFKIHTDSIERKVTVNKWGIDSSYYLHYTVLNLSSDTLTYLTNSCFYYNHYSLKVGQLEFDLNPTGECSFNAITPNKIAPGESFHQSEWITALNLHLLPIGEWSSTLSVPIIEHEQKTYRVDGRSFVKPEAYLTGIAQTKIIETHINNKKRTKL